jgi:SagB-type dehydrogenase family enzyme
VTTGAAFAIGMRHGRTELDFGPGGDAGARVATGASAAGGLARVEAFHAFSSHSRTHVLQRAPSSDWADAPPAFKRYAVGPQISMPAPSSSGASTFDLGALGTALWHTSGVTESRGGLALRAAPSSGALFSTELYVVARAVRGMSDGLWHYDPSAHRLVRIGDAVSDAMAALESSDPASKPQAFVVATALFGRTAHKYRDRTYRYVLADLGHALENLRVATSALGASAAFVAGFDESRIAAALGIDEAAEGVLAVLALGLALPAAARNETAPTTASTEWLIPDRMPAAASPLPVTAAIHTATSLRRSAAPASDSRASTRSAALPAGAIALPRATGELANVLGVIAAAGHGAALRQHRCRSLRSAACWTRPCASDRCCRRRCA